MINMQTCYLIRNICIIVFLIFLVVEIIYSFRVKIWNIIQKYYGIERRREIKRMHESHIGARNTARIRKTRYTVSSPSAGPLVQQETVLLDDMLEQKAEFVIIKNIVITH